MFETRGREVALISLGCVVLFYLVSGYLASSKLYKDRVGSMQRHEARLDPFTTEQGRTRVDQARLGLDHSPDFEKVHVGIYLDNIPELSTKATSWKADFYIWFKWRNRELDPGESFQIINGEVRSRQKIEEYGTDSQQYALYRVSALMNKFFDVVRYPLDNHLLTIHIEDADHPWGVLRYVPEKSATEYSSRIEIPGYRIQRAEIVSKPHAYKSGRGDPRLPENYQAVYSQVVYGLAIGRPDLGLYIKLFQGSFASVAVALLAFFFSPLSSGRIDLGVGAFFASVASSYLNLSELPGVGLVTLIDMVNGLAMATIFLSMFGSIISSRIAKGEGQQELAQQFDRQLLALFILGFVGVNVSMAFHAAAW